MQICKQHNHRSSFTSKLHGHVDKASDTQSQVLCIVWCLKTKINIILLPILDPRFKIYHKRNIICTNLLNIQYRYSSFLFYQHCCHNLYVGLKPAHLKHAPVHNGSSYTKLFSTSKLEFGNYFPGYFFWFSLSANSINQ